jgi:hypothetical protein
LAVDSEDNVLVAGNGSSLGASTGAGVFVRKYDPDGNELWTQLEMADPDAIHEATAMTVDGDDHVFVAGFGHYVGTSGGSGFVWLVPQP